MGEDEIKEFKKRLAEIETLLTKLEREPRELDYLKGEVEALRTTIGTRITQEFEINKQNVSHLREMLDLKIKPMEDALRHHCGEQRCKEEYSASELQRLRDQVQRVHKRVDELFKLLSAGGLPERIARIEVAVDSLVQQLTPVELPAPAAPAGPGAAGIIGLLPLLPTLWNWVKSLFHKD